LFDRIKAQPYKLQARHSDVSRDLKIGMYRFQAVDEGERPLMRLKRPGDKASCSVEPHQW